MINNNYNLIVLSGIDSSGKTTQIKKIKKYLLEKNKKVIVIWSRGGYTPIFNAIKLLLRKIIPNSIPEPGESKQRNKTFSKKWVRSIWINMALFDMILLYIFYFRILKIFNYNIIADRYLWDTFIDFKMKFHNYSFNMNIFWKFLLLFSPKSDFSFILNILYG